MKKMKLSRFLIACIATIAVLIACRPCDGETPAGEDMPAGCTVFTVAKGDRVFFGGNDDYITLDSYYWVEPGQGDEYGVVWVGTPDNVQQGVNEMGLAYDANGLPEVEMNPHRERTPWSGHMGSAQMHVLHECATVEEAIEWVQTHQVWPQMNDQRQYADASGDAVLISPGPDGELVFTRKPAGDGYLVSTNFNVINPEHGYGYPCWRYETVQGMLGDRIEGSGALTVEDATAVLDAVHEEGSTTWTRSSLLADLPNGTIYLTYFYQFDKPVVLNVADELAHPRAPGALSRLFPEDVQQEAARRYAVIQAQANRCRRAGMAWIGAVSASAVLLLVLSLVQRPVHAGSRGLPFWMPVVIVLGPLGFLAWLIAGRGKRPPPQPSPGDLRSLSGEGEEARAREGALASSPPHAGGTEGGRWRAALLEAAGDVTPTVVAFAAYLAMALSLPAVMGNGNLQGLLVFGLPLALSWLAFQGPLLARAAKRGYLWMLWKRLPHALVAANLGMAGVNVVAAPLINASLRTCSIFPSPGWSAGVLWALAVAGALLGGLLLFLYQLWAVRRGLAAWRVVAAGDREVRSGAWRMLWWWVLLSYVVLLGGVVASVVLQQLLAA